MNSVRPPLRTFSLGLLAQRVRAGLVTLGLGLRAAPASLDRTELRATRDVSIIVPVKDAPLLTAKCLESLARYAGDAEVILVDDASEQPATRGLLRNYAEQKGWILISLPTSVGHSGATAAGISRATRPLLCLLNSDTIVSPHCWEAIVACFKADPSVAIAGPSTSDTYGPQAMRIARQCKSDWNLRHVAAYARRQKLGTHQPETEDLRFIGGFAFFIRRSTWDELDGFDPNLPDYGNELDLCLRAVAAKLRCVWVKRSYIHHFGGSSYGGQVGGPDGIEARSLAATRYVREKAARLGLQLSHSD